MSSSVGVAVLELVTGTVGVFVELSRVVSPDPESEEKGSVARSAR